MSSQTNTYSLGDITILITDGKHGDCKNEKDSGYYFLSAKDIIEERLNYEKARQIDEIDFDETDKRTNLQPEDILFTNTGTIGRMAIAPDNELTRKTTFQKSVAIIKPKKDLVFPKYLFYLLKKENKRLCMFAEGTTQKNLLLKDLRSFHIGKIPELHYQKAIAHILGNLDERIELNKKTNETHEEIAKALFKSWFIDFDPVKAKAGGRSTGLPDEISDLFPDSFEESELGQIPKGWKMKTADQLCEVITKGTTPTSIGGQFSDEGIPFYKVESISESGQIIPGKYSFIDTEVDLLLKRSRIIEGDILFSIAGTIGRTTLMRKENVPANTNQALAILRPNNNLISSEFMYLYLRDKKRIELAISRVVQSVQANFSLGELKSLPLVVPSESLRKMFEGIIEKLFDKITTTHNNSIHLSEIRNALLPKLITGELRIPDAEKMIEETEI